jgi:cytochrome c-type biogenesis protein CcmH/NrfG
MTTAAHSAFALQDARSALRRGDLSAAMTAAQSTTAFDPGEIEAWYILGTAAAGLNDFSTAEHAFGEGARRAPANTPTQAQMLTLRAQPLMAAGRPSEAVESLRAAMKIGIPDPTGLALASVTLTHAGLPQEALPLLLKATEANPRHVDAWFNLGGVRQFLGDIDGAQAAYERAIDLAGQPYVPAHHALARLRRWTADNNHIARLEALQCRDGKEACSVAFALFKEYDDIGDTVAAWDALQHGAMLARSMEQWSSAEEAALIAAWKEHLPPERFAVADVRPRSGPKRIFIIGLPRSGTTLVERILAAHSQVQAIGELKTFGIVIKRLTGTTTPGLLDAETIAAAMTLDPLAIAEAYTAENAYLSDGSAYTIDKLPNNHDYAGLIRLAFPDAIIIGLDRNPMDALFGAYKLLFTGAHGWSYSQDDLADHYAQFRDLMDYWKQVMGDGLIEVSLEALIGDPDTQIRQLIAATGLPFEEACLRPHEAKGAVTTASAGQVRKPINAEGIGAWKRYATQLEPLRQRLSDMGYLT